MAKFKFVGEKGEAAKDVTAFGVSFPSGKVVDVTDPAAVRKLQGNREFEQVSGKDSDEDYTGPESEGRAPKVAPAPDAAARAAAEKADAKAAAAERAAERGR